MKVFNTPNELLGAQGEHLGFSDWMEIKQDRIDQFADATGDHQWIHVDAERAKDGPFGATIAHGYLTMSLASYFMPLIFEVQNISMGVNYGVDKVRFPAPVPVGSMVRGGAEVISAEELKGGIHVVVRVTIEIQGSDRPGAVVDTVSRFFP